MEVIAQEQSNKRVSLDVVVAAGVILILSMMIIPLPPIILDVLFAINISAAIIILLVAVYLNNPSELSIFPSLLLVLTLFRLALNISSTRLILGQGFAGEIINAFGDFIVGGNYVVGFIMFIILVLINFMVITKGSGRISEVAARFTLDAMPGKQMAIDADLGAGIIDEEEARDRRKKISMEAEFYGAMDGASKFVKGDAIAGLIITAINLIAGFIIGMAQLSMNFQESIETYSILTIGDGLVSQVPALIISTAAGMVVARSNSDSTMGLEIKAQLFTNVVALRIVAVTMLVFGFVPGMPLFPFLVISLALILYSRGKSTKSENTLEISENQEEEVEQKEDEKIEEYLQVDNLELEIGYGLIRLVDKTQGGDLFDRITSIRKQIAVELGIIVPPIRIRDNMQLLNNQYLIKIKGIEVGKGDLRLNYFLAMDSGGIESEVDGIDTREPAFGLPAKWIRSDQKDDAEISGYTVVEPAAVLSTHLIELVRKNADKLLGREETQKLIETVKEKNPTVINELNLESFSIGNVQKILQGLLKEGLSIRDLVTIFEAIADYLPLTKNVEVLIEYVRHSLSNYIAETYSEEDGVIRGFVLEPNLEQMVTESIRNQNDPNPVISPADIDEIATQMKDLSEKISIEGHLPIIFTSPQIRSYFKRMFESTFPDLIVLSYGELPATQAIESLGKIGK
jgi:flagellar biosynthesis protein FlhA